MKTIPKLPISSARHNQQEPLCKKTNSYSEEHHTNKTAPSISTKQQALTKHCLNFKPCRYIATNHTGLQNQVHSKLFGVK